VDFTNKRKEQNKVQSLGDRYRSGLLKTGMDPKKIVKGAKYIDCLNRPWGRGDVCGILAGAGVGKTTFVLNMFKEILENNIDSDEVCVFVSLEMTEAEIAEKWFKLVGDSPISDRLYVIENYDENQKAKALNTNGIKLEMLKLRETLGVGILSWALDHLHIININNAMDYNATCDEIKQISVEMNSFCFLLSQTTKGKGAGDVPVPKDGCYGCSKYEWNCSYIISIFQPLMKIQSKAPDMPVLAWQYAKIRFKNRKDKVKEAMNYLLVYDFDSESLRELSRDEKSKFGLLYEEVLILRQNEEKFKTFQFDLSEHIKGKDGKTIRLDRIVGGTKPESLDDEL
jgi:hypothetical protein